MKVVVNAPGYEHVMCGPPRGGALKATHTLAHVHTHMQLRTHVLYLEAACMYTYAHSNICPLRLLGPLYTLRVHPRVPVAALDLPTALAEPLSQLVITTLPPRSPLVLSCCALTICSNWPGPGASCYPHNWRPESLRTHMPGRNSGRTHGDYSCDVTVMCEGGIKKRGAGYLLYVRIHRKTFNV